MLSVAFGRRATLVRGVLAVGLCRGLSGLSELQYFFESRHKLAPIDGARVKRLKVSDLDGFYLITVF